MRGRVRKKKKRVRCLGPADVCPARGGRVTLFKGGRKVFQQRSAQQGGGKRPHLGGFENGWEKEDEGFREVTESIKRRENCFKPALMGEFKDTCRGERIPCKVLLKAEDMVSTLGGGEQVHGNNCSERLGV